MHQFVMGQRSTPYTCHAIFMLFGLRSRGFMRFHFTTFYCFGILLGCDVRLCNHFRDALLSFARHGWSHRSFKYSPRILENFFVLSVISLEKVNSSHFSSIVELCFCFCPFLFLSVLSGFTNFRPNFWPYMIWSGFCLNLRQSHLDNVYPFGDFSFKKVNIVNPVHEFDKRLPESTFQ